MSGAVNRQPRQSIDRLCLSSDLSIDRPSPQRFRVERLLAGPVERGDHAIVPDVVADPIVLSDVNEDLRSVCQSWSELK